MSRQISIFLSATFAILLAASLPTETSNSKSLQKRYDVSCFRYDPERPLIAPNPDDCFFAELDVVQYTDLTRKFRLSLSDDVSAIPHGSGLKIPAKWTHKTCNIVIGSNEEGAEDITTLNDIANHASAVADLCTTAEFPWGGRTTTGNANLIDVVVMGGILDIEEMPIN